MRSRKHPTTQRYRTCLTESEKRQNPEFVVSSTSRIVVLVPFVVSDLQIGLMLQGHGAPLSNKKKERAGVYLTNALTGWEPPEHPKKLPFVELEAERNAAYHVKRETPILVILGNPPYNGFALEMARDITSTLVIADNTGIARHQSQRGVWSVIPATQT
jgi:hypothetical protein